MRDHFEDNKARVSSFYFAVFVFYLIITLWNFGNNNNDEYYKSTMKDSYSGTIDCKTEPDGSKKLLWYNWPEFVEWAKKQDKRLYIRVGTKRSKGQNNLLHSYIDQICEFQCGPDYGNEDFENTKKDLKIRWGKGFEEYVDKETGEIIKILRSTSAYSVQEMTSFTKWIEQFAADTLGYVMKSKGENQEMNF